MKRKLLALLCAMLVGLTAFAESAVPSPEAGTSAQTGSMSASLNGAPLTLDFDPDPQFSFCRDGYVQASFYAYGEGDLLYELYVTFPQDVSSGQTVTPESCMHNADIFSGIYLYISDSSSDRCSAATQYPGGPYPENASYSIAFDSVSADGSHSTYTGSLDAELVEVDLNYSPTGTVNAFSGSFSFTMELGSASLPGEERAVPKATQPPAEENPPGPGETPGEAPSQPAPTPEPFREQRPPTPPAKLITPSNARRI